MNGSAKVSLEYGEVPDSIREDFVVLPHGHNINEFTPVQHPANDMTTDITTTISTTIRSITTC